MKTETISVTNKNGDSITLSFDAANLIQDTKGIGLRIPMQCGECSRVIILHAFKANYPTAEIFLARFEQFGKHQITQWLQTSSDVIDMPPPDIIHGWGIGFEGS